MIVNEKDGDLRCLNDLVDLRARSDLFSGRVKRGLCVGHVTSVSGSRRFRLSYGTPTADSIDAMVAPLPR